MPNPATNNFRIHLLATTLAMMFMAWSTPSQGHDQLVAKIGHWQYQITFDNADVGTMQITSQLKEDGYYLESQSQLSVPSFWGSAQMQSRLAEIHQLDGTLSQADNLLNQDDNTHWTKIELKNNEYLAMGAKLPTPGQQEIVELTDLVKQAVIHMVPNAGHVITLGEVLLADEKNSIDNSRLSKTDFDTSFAALPLYWQQNDYALPKQLTIFDTENMLLFQASSQFIGKQALATKTGQIAAYHYRLTLEDKSQLDVWLTKLNQNLSYFAQIKGQDNGTKYTVSLAK